MCHLPRWKINPRPTAAVPMLWPGLMSTSTSATPCPREVRAKNPEKGELMMVGICHDIYIYVCDY